MIAVRSDFADDLSGDYQYHKAAIECLLKGSLIVKANLYYPHNH